jgi:hypothetical protein
MRCVAVAFIFILSACSNNKLKQGTIKLTTAKKEVNQTPALKSDTVAYDDISLDTRNDKCEDCNYVTINYPDIRKATHLKAKIDSIVWGDLDIAVDVNYTTFSDFRKTFDSYKKNFPAKIDTSMDSGAIYANHSIAIERQAPGLIVLNIEDEMSGGIHPQSQVIFSNWNTATDKAITLNDIFVKDYEDKLTAIAEKIFRKDAGLSAKAPLKDYTFENDEFALNDNFRITNEGISFYYNTYEIRPYMFGTTDLLIPYSQIKHLLRPNTVVTQYIK